MCSLAEIKSFGDQGMFTICFLRVAKCHPGRIRHNATHNVMFLLCDAYLVMQACCLMQSCCLTYLALMEKVVNGNYWPSWSNRTHWQ